MQRLDDRDHRAGELTGLSWETLDALSGASLPAGALEDLRRFYDELERANTRTNLTRIQGEQDFLERHALDALLGAPTLTAGPLLDIGSGGGIPGLVLAIARPTWQVTLLEAASRKTQFLTAAVEALGLGARVKVVQQRAERYAHDAREAFQSVTLRAVSGGATCLELGLPFVAVGGRLLLYRGPEVDDELPRLRAVAELLGGGDVRVETRALPSGAARRLVLVDKVHATPPAYPRRDGVPAKRPLG